MDIIYIPETPAGTLLFELEAKTEQGAWDKLRNATKHMPYKNKADLIKRGYKVLKFTPQEQSQEPQGHDEG